MLKYPIACGSVCEIIALHHKSPAPHPRKEPILPLPPRKPCRRHPKGPGGPR